MYDKGRTRDAGPHSTRRQAADTQGLWWTERHVLGLDASWQATSAVLLQGPLRHKDPRQFRSVVCAAMLQAWCTKGLAWRRMPPQNHNVTSKPRTCVIGAAMLQAQRLKGTV